MHSLFLFIIIIYKKVEGVDEWRVIRKRTRKIDAGWLDCWIFPASKQASNDFSQMVLYLPPPSMPPLCADLICMKHVINARILNVSIHYSVP
jgi:hypothetical protein